MNFFVKDAVVFMKVKLEQNAYVPSRIDMRFVSVNSLEEAQHDMMQNFTIKASADLFDKHLNKILVKYIKDNKGPTQIKIMAFDPQTHTPLTLTVPHRVTLTYDFVEAIEQFEGVTIAFE